MKSQEPVYMRVPLDLIELGTNVRVDDQGLDSLVASIKKHGVLQPITVVPLEGDDGRVECLFGHRRLAAAKLAELDVIPCLARPRDRAEVRVLTGIGRLGRHVEHDPASWAFQAARAATLVTVVHHRRSHPFDQGDVGSCTGNAMAGLLDTAPFTHSHLGERTALKLYEEATRLDGYPGTYPPDDTGSSGLAVAKAAKKLGYITAYSHAFGLQHVLESLVIAPGITGIHWYDSFDSPPMSGIIEISPNAGVRGGHELEVSEIHVDEQLIGGWNSWGDWGPLHGRWLMRWTTYERLLAEQGDYTTVTPPA